MACRWWPLPPLPPPSEAGGLGSGGGMGGGRGGGRGRAVGITDATRAIGRALGGRAPSMTPPSCFLPPRSVVFGCHAYVCPHASTRDGEREQGKKRDYQELTRHILRRQRRVHRSHIADYCWQVDKIERRHKSICASCALASVHVQTALSGHVLPMGKRYARAGFISSSHYRDKIRRRYMYSLQVRPPISTWGQITDTYSVSQPELENINGNHEFHVPLSYMGPLGYLFH